MSGLWLQGHDVDWFRDALAKRGLFACIPEQSEDPATASPPGRGAHTFFSAICNAATAIFWP